MTRLILKKLKNLVRNYLKSKKKFSKKFKIEKVLKNKLCPSGHPNTFIEDKIIISHCFKVMTMNNGTTSSVTSADFQHLRR
jgi:hypothetical protein